uniref:Uncharacterized protein n=1 Tax=Amphilophus citrinellus TaxID=61819 RepID=A0A3Q0STM0_AMPCI
MLARVAGILAPLIRLLSAYHYTIPMLIYGIIPIVAGGLCLLLPETLTKLHSLQKKNLKNFS